MVEKETSQTTKRGLTLDDLLSQLKHYSSGVRKGKYIYSSAFIFSAHTYQDAIHGLIELLDQHTNLVEQHLLRLVNACARLIGDEVRFIPMSSLFIPMTNLGCFGSESASFIFKLDSDTCFEGESLS